jgi:hypothetical protein
MMADAKFLELACTMSSIEAKPVIPQHATKYVSKTSKLKCFPAEYASAKRTRKGALIGKFQTSLVDLLLFVGFASAHPRQALHMRLM